MLRLTRLLLLLALITACAPAAPMDSQTPSLPTIIEKFFPGSAATPWWREAVFYEIFVRSFNDSNGDGIGDFNGITLKLDYLQSLGVTALWLMPIHPSPSYHGYDVLNYYTVNPQYGTLNDFKRLLSEAHSRGLRVIIDFVPNHTSSGHPFFQSALNPQSPYRDYYVWSENDPGQNGAYGGTAWHKTDHGYYYGLFWGGMPDLNYLNPRVTAQMENVVRFWLTDVGVDGFRIDAVKHLIEENGKQENTPATHAWLKGFYSFYKTLDTQAYTVGEVFGAGGTLIKSYSGGQMDQIFNFELASGYLNSARGEGSSGVVSALKFAQMDAADGNYASFLANHDQERVMSELGGDVNKAKVAAALLLTGPGTPYLYYGEEIGMQGVKPDELIRTPMQWTSDPATAGFTTGIPWHAPNHTAGANVAAEDQDPNSLLNYYRELIALRKAHPALQSGSTILLETNSPAVYAALRSSPAETLLVISNLSRGDIAGPRFSLASGEMSDGSHQPLTLLGCSQPPPVKIIDGAFRDYVPTSTLPAFTTCVFRLY